MLDTSSGKGLDPFYAAHYYARVHYKIKLLSLSLLSAFFGSLGATEPEPSFALVAAEPLSGASVATWCERSAVLLDDRTLTEHAIFRLSFEGPKAFYTDDEIRREHRRSFAWRAKQRLWRRAIHARNHSIQDQILDQQNALLQALKDPLQIPRFYKIIGERRVPEGSYSFNIQNATDSFLINIIKKWHTLNVWDPVGNKMVVVHASVVPLLKFLVERGIDLESKPAGATQTPIEVALQQHDVDAVIYLASLTKALPAGFYDLVVSAGWSTQELQRLPRRLSPSPASLRRAVASGDGPLFRFLLERGSFSEGDLQRLVKEISGHSLDAEILNGLEPRPFDKAKALARLADFSAITDPIPSLRVLKLVDFKTRILKHLFHSKGVNLNIERIADGDRYPGTTPFELAIRNEESQVLSVDEFVYLGRKMAYFFTAEKSLSVDASHLLEEVLSPTDKGFYNLSVIHIVLDFLLRSGPLHWAPTSDKNFADIALKLGLPLKSVLGVMADLGLKPSSRSIQLFFTKVSQGRRSDAFDAHALRELFEIYPDLEPSEQAMVDVFRTGRFLRLPRRKSGQSDSWTPELLAQREAEAVARQEGCLQTILARNSERTADFVVKHPTAIFGLYGYLSEGNPVVYRPVTTSRLPLVKMVISRFGMDYNAVSKKTHESFAYRVMMHKDFETMRYLLTLRHLNLSVPEAEGEMLSLATRLNAPADIIEELRYR